MAKSIIKHKVILTAEQRADLERMLRQSSIGVAKKRWATILLRADQDHPDGGDTDEQIADEVGISVRHLERIRKKFALGGFDAALARKPRSDAGIPKVFDGPTEAQLVVLACSEPPEGRATWTLQLLCTELARLKVVTRVCPETVRTCLKKTSSSPGKSSGSASPRTTGRDSSPRWRPSSKSTKLPTTPNAR